MKHLKSQLMRDIYCHEYIVEQEDLIIRVIPIEQIGHEWSSKGSYFVIDYTQKREMTCKTYEEANRTFFDKTKGSYYYYPISISEFAGKKIIIKKGEC